jgi:hypothetical protein
MVATSMFSRPEQDNGVARRRKEDDASDASWNNNNNSNNDATIDVLSSKLNKLSIQERSDRGPP